MYISNVLNKIQVLTPSGFKDFSGIEYKGKREVWTVSLCDSTKIEITPNHILINEFGVETTMDKLFIGDLIYTKSGLKMISNIEINHKHEDVFDLINVDGKLYYTNDILSHNCEFAGSTYTLIGSDVSKSIKDRKDKIQIQKQIRNLAGYDITVYENPLPNRVYVMGVDVSDGVGVDYSVIRIIDITRPLNAREVVNFKSNTIPTWQFPFIIAQLACEYNMAIIMIEANGVGRGIVDTLYNLYEYTNIPSIGHKKRGIHSSQSIKNDACDTFRNMAVCSKSNIILHDDDIFSELDKFERFQSANGTSVYKAKHGHDDNVMSVIWAFYMLDKNTKVCDKYFDVIREQIDYAEIVVSLKHYQSESELKRDKELNLVRINKINNTIQEHLKKSGISK